VKRLLIVGLCVLFTLPLFGKKILLMEPIIKDVGSESKISKEIEKVFKKKYEYVSYRDVKSKLLEKLKKCGSKAGCWYEEAGDADFDYAALFLIKEEDDEVLVRLVLIDIDGESNISDEKQSFGSVDDLSAGKIYKKIMKDAFGPIAKKIAKTGDDDEGGDEDDDSGSKSKVSERQKREEELARKEREAEERRERLAEEKRQREEELERKREEAERKRRLAEEKKREEEERERARLEEERKRREEEREESNARKRDQLEKNQGKLEKARELVLKMCSDGKYNEAIQAIVKVSQLKCECEEDAKVLALKSQLLNFNKVRDKILEGVNLLNYSLILDNLEAAKALDTEIVPGGTEFSQKIDTIYAIGYYAKALDMEKKDNYVVANENYEKCLQKDPDKKECKQWNEEKDKTVKKLFDKAKVMKNFNPTKAKDLFRSILKLVTAEHEYYKQAETELKSMEY
jgi:hypothetical protein